MHNIELFDESFKRFIKNINDFIHDGIIDIHLPLLKEMDLLHFHDGDSHNPSLTRYFHVIETKEKITLINDQFVVWIVPDKNGQIPTTLTLIALNKVDGPHLEAAYQTTGVYNTSKLVLRVLEKFLVEIEENEDLLKSFS